MKKLLVLFVMLFGMSNVYALEYSDYSDFSEYTDKYVQGDDLTDVKVERRYKYYKYEKELGGYGENDSLDYPYFDKDDYIYTEYSNVSLDKPEIKEGRVIETVLGHHYSKIKDINFILFHISMGFAVLDDFEVLYKGEPIDYDTEFTKATSDFKIEQEGSILLRFADKIDIRYITVSFNVIEAGGNLTSIGITTGYDDEKYTYYSYNRSANTSVYWKPLDLPGYASSYEDYYSEELSPIGRACRHIDDVTLYKYKDIMYHNYNLIKIYSDDYLSEPFEDYIYRDESMFKDFYAFRTRTIIFDEPKAIESVVDDPVNTVATDNLNNNFVQKEVLDKTDSVYQIPEKAIYYPVNINKIEDLKEVNMFKVIYPFILIFIILVILILVLSKLYKKKKECVKV